MLCCLLDARVQNASAPGDPPDAPLTAMALVADDKGVRRLLAVHVPQAVLKEALFVASASAPLMIDGKTFQPIPEKVMGPRYARIVAMLLEKGASIKWRNEFGETPLIAAAGCGYFEVVRLLIEKGAEIDAVDGQGRTALLSAATEFGLVNRTDTYESARLLVEAGANIEAAGPDGDTPLISAAAAGRSRHVALLLRKGARIEARNERGETPLMAAASRDWPGVVDVVALLLKSGADPRARNSQGFTALDLARRNKQASAARLLEAVMKKPR